MQNFRDATQDYERWLGRHTPLVQADLRRKHVRMRANPSQFLRGTFYRWVQWYDTLPNHLVNSPNVLAVGDLHIENFGTWRDAEGRLVWGINDFDEAAWLPFTNDLLRLATSAVLTRALRRLRISVADISEAILLGYRECLKRSGKPFVLAEEDRWLWDIATNALRDPGPFWKKLRKRAKQAGRLPRDVRMLLNAAMPSGAEFVRIGPRVAGLGSLGRPRYVAVGQVLGGWVAREARALLPSAVQWARHLVPRPPAYRELMERSIRDPDPFTRVQGSWLLRRLAPDSSRIELEFLPKRYDEYRLMHAMGWETANVHLGSALPSALLRHLRTLGKSWLPESTEQMKESLLRDWKGF